MLIYEDSIKSAAYLVNSLKSRARNMARKYAAAILTQNPVKKRMVAKSRILFSIYTEEIKLFCQSCQGVRSVHPVAIMPIISKHAAVIDTLPQYPLLCNHQVKKKTRFLSIVSVVLLVTLFASGTRVFAQPSHNPIFVTLEQVQQLVDTALSPLQAALTSLGNRVSGVEAVNASQAAHLSELDERIASQSAQITGLNNHDTSTDESIRNLSSRMSNTENSVRLLENTMNDGHFQVSWLMLVEWWKVSSWLVRESA
jgi:hypothetical protein